MIKDNKTKDALIRKQQKRIAELEAKETEHVQVMKDLRETNEDRVKERTTELDEINQQLM